MIEFIGRLHPLIVHLPLGILLLAACLHFLSRSKKNRSLIGAARVALFFGALSALLACVTGVIKTNDSYDLETVTQHKYMGIASAFISLMLLLFFNTRLVHKKGIHKAINTTLFLLLLPSIIITGHLGGSLTHGSDFLFPDVDFKIPLQYASSPFRPDSSIYSQLVRPLLQEKCYDCHSSKKQKGKLRLDTKAFIVKGGKSGSIIDRSDSGENELLYRIHLPVDDDDHMPPSDNEQLSSGEIDLLTSWIESGAPFNATLRDYPDSSVINKYLTTTSQKQISEWWPQEKAPLLDRQAVNELIDVGVSVELLYEESNYVSASFVSLDSIADDVWSSLLRLKNNLISLRFSGIRLSQEDIDHLPAFPTMRRLYLDDSMDEPLDLNSLFVLNELRYLNLSNNAIDYERLSNIHKLKYLENLVIFNINLNKDELDSLKKKLPTCNIECFQYRLPELPSDTHIYRRKK